VTDPAVNQGYEHRGWRGGYNNMEGKEEHHGREHVGTAVGLAAEFIAMTFGVIWLAWIAGIFVCLAVFGYTKKMVRERPKVGWGIRVAAILFTLAAAVIMTMPKKHAMVATNGESAPSPSQQVTAPNATSEPSVPADNKRAKKSDLQKPPAPSVSSSGSQSPATGGITQGQGSALSFNQQGGITAGTVNIAPPARHLAAEQKAEIVAALQGQTCSITMMGALSNVEDAQNYALELMSAFKAGGCTVPSTVQPMMSSGRTWSGITVEYHTDTEHVDGEKVFTPPDTPPDVILQALRSAHLENVMVGGGPVIPKDTIRVVIGGRAQ
jgi:hypothetical protein